MCVHVLADKGAEVNAVIFSSATLHHTRDTLVDNVSTSVKDNDSNERVDIIVGTYIKIPYPSPVFFIFIFTTQKCASLFGIIYLDFNILIFI